MTSLVLDLKADDLMIINGAPLRFCNKVRIELNGRARFLFGKQIMPPGHDTTPARRIYYAVQTAYIGYDHERSVAREQAHALCEDFASATTSPTIMRILEEVRRAVDDDRCYDALKLVRRVMRHEDAVILAAKPVAEQAAA